LHHRYHQELEKQRLAFEMELKMKDFALQEKEYKDRKRWEEEDREEIKRIEEERLRKENQERELRWREIAIKEREIEMKKAMKESELQLARERDGANNTVVHRAQLFGDAMKNNIARMATDVVELVSYFKDVEQLFENFGVPEDLKAQLLRP